MSSDDKGFLDGAYDLTDVKKTGEHYDKWAATYEQELLKKGYVTPQRCAAALAKHVADLTGPLLDLGCGTGLSGLALRDAGFTTIDGFDYSKEMLAGARAKTGVYRALDWIDMSVPLPFEVGRYANACAAGVVNPGHAPIEAIRYTMDVLPPGGCFALSLNDHALEEHFDEGVRDVVADGVAQLLFEEHGPHIPGINLESTVYVLRKLPV